MMKEELTQKVIEYLVQQYDCDHDEAIDLVVGHPDIRDGGDVFKVAERIAQNNYLLLRGLHV